MDNVKLYMLLKSHKDKFTRQQYFTIKGQIQKGDLLGAYKGMLKIIKE